jgi:hypothetical protein
MPSTTFEREPKVFDGADGQREPAWSPVGAAAPAPSRQWPRPPSPVATGIRPQIDKRMAARLLVATVALGGAFAAGALAVELGLPVEHRMPGAGGAATSAPAAAPTTAPRATPQPAPDTIPNRLVLCADSTRWAAMRQPVAVAKNPCPRWLEARILRLAVGGR